MLTIAITIGQGMRVTQGHLSMSTYEWREQKKNGKRPFRVCVKLSKDDDEREEKEKEKKSTKGMDNYLIYMRWILIFQQTCMWICL